MSTNTRRVLAVLVVAAVAAEMYAFRGRIGAGFAAFGRIDWSWATLAVVAALVSICGFTRVQRRMLRAGGADIDVPRMIGLVYTANAINWTFPGGTALSAGYVYKRLRNWGTPAAAIGFALTASGVLFSLTLVALCLGYAVLSGGSIASTLLGGIGGGVLLLAAVFA